MLTVTCTARLTKRTYVAENTMAFDFEKPSGFHFKPGQYINVTLIDPPETDPEGNTRSFSIVTAPHEGHLTIVTRMRDTAFKRTLLATPVLGEVELEGPLGYFTMHHNPTKPAVLLAGGIGITPYLSMLRHATKQRLSPVIYLFYSNRRPEDAAFMETLRELARDNSNFHFIPTMTEMAGSQQEWTDEMGFIDSEMLARYLTSFRGPIYYVAGSPAVVAAMRKMLVAAPVDEDYIISEDFVGY
jgi:ferredoxin-NADP reductase